MLLVPLIIGVGRRQERCLLFLPAQVCQPLVLTSDKVNIGASCIPTFSAGQFRSIKWRESMFHPKTVKLTNFAVIFFKFLVSWCALPSAIRAGSNRWQFVAVQCKAQNLIHQYSMGRRCTSMEWLVGEGQT